MSTSSYKAKSELEFPTEMPPYGVWWDGNTFTLHKSLTAVKNAVTAKATDKAERSWAWNRHLAWGAGEVH